MINVLIVSGSHCESAREYIDHNITKIFINLQIVVIKKHTFLGKFLAYYFPG